jgi:F0F1-type ATP synthase alpha subunit
VELLKQDQFVPISMAEQTCILFAGVRGYVDKVDIKLIGAFETAWRRHIRDSHSEILDQLNKEKEISSELETRLGEICSQFVANF